MGAGARILLATAVLELRHTDGKPIKEIRISDSSLYQNQRVQSYYLAPGDVIEYTDETGKRKKLTYEEIE